MKRFVKSFVNPFRPVVAMALLLGAAAGCSKAREITPGVPWYPLSGPLIPARMTMVTAWDIPKNPLTDPALDDSRLSKEIRWGYRIFMNTPGEGGRLTPSRMSCNNCHLNAGQRERALPLVGVAGLFPEYNKRAGRLITLADRIVDCFLRSENATGCKEGRGALPGAVHVVPRRRRPRRRGRRQEAGPAVGARLVERRRRRSACLHARAAETAKPVA
jgi:hypothetical protein